MAALLNPQRNGAGAALLNPQYGTGVGRSRSFGRVLMGGLTSTVPDPTPSAGPIGTVTDWVIAALGDSLTALSYQCDPSRWGLPITRTPPRVVVNAGVQNENVTQIKNRTAAFVTAAVAAGANGVMLRAGTNGYVEADYADILDQCIAAGLAVFCHQIPPKDLTVASFIIARNASIASLCAARPGWALYVEDSAAMADSSYAALPGMLLSDGIHHAALGQYTSGVAQAAILAPYFTADPRLTNPADISSQWVRNPHMVGTGGAVSGALTGVAPNDWAAYSSGLAASLSIVAADVGDPVQVPWLRVAITSSSGYGQYVLITWACDNPAISADVLTYKRFDDVVEVRFNSLDTSNLFSFDHGLKSMMNGGIGTLSHTCVFRHALPRDQGGATPTAFAMNSLAFGVQVLASAAFSGSIGSFDLRLPSAIGLAT